MKICLVQLGRIGDMILMTPGIQMIKKTYPDAEIYFIAGPSNYFIVNNNPNVKETLIFDKNPLKLLKFIKKLRSINFDYYIDPKDHYSSESSLIAKLSKAASKIGFNDNKHKSFDISIPSSEDNIGLHFVERLRHCITYITKEEPELYKPEIFLEVQSIENVNNYIKNNNIKSFTVLNFSASNLNKMWEKDKWIDFINKTKHKENYVIISSAEHYNTIQDISKKTNILCFPPSDLNTISALISKAKLLITPDTSCVHIAAAFNIPVIALTCNVPWSVTKFKPLSSKNIMILPKEINARLDAISVNEAIEQYNYFYKTNII